MITVYSFQEIVAKTKTINQAQAAPKHQPLSGFLLPVGHSLADAGKPTQTTQEE